MKLNKGEHFNSFIFYDKYLSENEYVNLIIFWVFCTDEFSVNIIYYHQRHRCNQSQFL